MSSCAATADSPHQLLLNAPSDRRIPKGRVGPAEIIQSRPFPSATRRNYHGTMTIYATAFGEAFPGVDLGVHVVRLAHDETE